MICVVCPRGCRMEVQADEDGHAEVSGAGCVRGRTYAAAEMSTPVRTVTTTVAVTGASISRLPVKSAVPVPRDQVIGTVQALHSIEVCAPIRRGDVVAANVAGTGISFVATRDLPAQRTRAGK